MGSMVLLDLMGGVALLLWGLHMVHSGILRAFGPDLRSLLAGALKNRFSAFAAGIGLTALLQSSTATAAAKIGRQGFSHGGWPPSPALRVNHDLPSKGIPFDSGRSENALAILR